MTKSSELTTAKEYFIKYESRVPSDFEVHKLYSILLYINDIKCKYTGANNSYQLSTLVRNEYKCGEVITFSYSGKSVSRDGIDSFVRDPEIALPANTKGYATLRKKPYNSIFTYDSIAIDMDLCSPIPLSLYAQAVNLCTVRYYISKHWKQLLTENFAVKSVIEF